MIIFYSKYVFGRLDTRDRIKDDSTFWIHWNRISKNLKALNIPSNKYHLCSKDMMLSSNGYIFYTIQLTFNDSHDAVRYRLVYDDLSTTLRAPMRNQ